MKINKVTASFGKLKNESLYFHDGLNVIYAPNESGKSTWCAFIRAMLYGIDSSERAKNGYIPDKQKYAPWSGAPMEGTMDLNADACNITLTRTTKTASAPMREFSAVYTGTSTPVQGLTGTNAGTELTGVSSAVFRRTAFIEQGTLAVTENPELEKRIAAIVSSGDENTSYTDADSRLRGWSRKRRFNKKGALPALEDRMDAIERTLAGIESSVSDAAILEQELQQAKAECQRLENAMTESRKVQRKNALTRMTEGRGEIDRRVKDHEIAVEKLYEARDDLRNSFFGAQPYTELKEQADKDIEKLDHLNKVSAGKNPFSPLFTVLFLVLSAVFATLYIRNESIWFILPSVVMLLGGIAFLLLSLKAKNTAQNAREEARNLLLQYHCSSVEDLLSNLEKHRQLYEAAEKASNYESETRLACEDAQLRQVRIENSVMGDLDFVEGSSEAARLSRQLSDARNRIIDLSSRLSTLNGKMLANGDSMVLQSELTVISEKHDRLEKEYEALGIAMETLKEANDEIQSRFSPELGKLASDYMARMTGGRYQKVLIDRDFSAMTRTEMDPIARKSEYLSAGTLDLMYLAVRLAVCELALPNGEPCPLIIDDALVNLDETRTQQALELLRELGKKRQVILFTCRKLTK